MLAFLAVEAKSCTEEGFCPAAEVLAGASKTLELLPLILPLAVYTTEKVNSVRSNGGNRKQREQGRQEYF